MNAVDLRGAVGSLPSYEPWQEKSAELAKAAETRPEHISKGSPVSKLEAEIEYQKKAEEIALPQAFDSLRAEIAEAIDDIPLAYRIGMLAVLDNPLADNPPHGFMRLDIQAAFEDPSLPEMKPPPEDDYERATAMGDAITETSALISNDELTPLLPFHLWRNEDGTFEYKAENIFLIKERDQGGFVVREPEVSRHQGTEAVRYWLPVLRCYNAYLKSHDEFAISGGSSSSCSREVIDVPQFMLLLTPYKANSLHPYKKLLTGSAAVAFTDARSGHYLDQAS